jgi:hypothetical protein
VAPRQLMDERPDIHAFPAKRLGAFLRAMADPEGRGDFPPEQEQHILKLEERLANSRPPRREQD